MPTYDYFCPKCGGVFELFHPISQVQTQCPSCHTDTLERRISGGAGIIFKGSGFYETDYKHSNGASQSSSAKNDK